MITPPTPKVPKFTDTPCRACGSPCSTINPAWLREQRVRAGLGLREMANRLGFSAPYVSDIERGNRRANPAIVKAYEALS